jgi:hypothetical protein
MMRSATDFLPLHHQHVDEFGNVLAAEFRIRQDFALGYFSTTWHFSLVLYQSGFLARLAPYFERDCLRSLTP